MPKKAQTNSLLVILPYRFGGGWAFDDSRVGLIREPFVCGIPQMIDLLVKDIPDADQGFQLTFSAVPFPGAQIELDWDRTEGGGNYYRWDAQAMEGWLCPALFHYFDEAPLKLYASAAFLKPEDRPKPQPHPSEMIRVAGEAPLQFFGYHV